VQARQEPARGEPLEILASGVGRFGDRQSAHAPPARTKRPVTQSAAGPMTLNVSTKTRSTQACAAVADRPRPAFSTLPAFRQRVQTRI
jgi:hypothetical protein